MRFFNLLFVLALALALAWFSARNWTPVTLALWPPYQMMIQLPVLVVLCVLIGWIPTSAVNAFSRWRLKRRLLRAEAELLALRAPASAMADEPDTGTPFEMPVLKSKAALPREPGTFVPPHIPTPPADGL